MKKLLIFLICSVLVFSSLSFAAGAADIDLNGEAADADITEQAADTDNAQTAATADEVSPTGWSLLSESEFQSELTRLRSKYPNGSVWGGVYYESGYAKAWECWAYAAQMMYEVFGARFYADGLMNYKYYNAYAVCAGDWVRIDWDSHSIFITKVTDNGVYYTDGNGTGVYNQVRWDGYYSWSEFASRFYYGISLPGNNLTGRGINHTIVYNANGGSGSMASQTVGAGAGFTIKSNGFTRSGYTFAGYIVKRSYDSKWFTSGGTKWQSESAILTSGYRYSLYYPGESYSMSSNWLDSYTASTSFTFYAQWIPKNATVEYLSNYSGYNYILGSNLGSGYSDYIYSRDSSNYTVSVDSSQKLNNANSLKIIGKKAGYSGSDLAIKTSTNKGYGDGYDQPCTVGDDKTFTLHFYAKASVKSAAMYFRWGYSSSFTQPIVLTNEWRVYTVKIPKNRYCGATLHPFFDTAGTYYINSLSLGDNTGTSNVVPETGTWEASTQTVALGETLPTMPNPKRSGYIFLGWFTAAEGGKRVTTDTPITDSTIRLYAHWRKEISYTPVKTVKHNGHIYELYDNSLGWTEANAFCNQLGGHLITIGSKAENDTAYSMINDRQGYCWIGLNCVTQPSGWEWVDNTDLSAYNNWYNPAYGQDDSGEYYALLYPMNYGTTAYAGTWDKCKGSSYYCSYYGYYNSFFICEYDDPIYRGDTDGSGIVDAIDATLIQRYNAGYRMTINESILMRGDINENEELDLLDATLIQRYAASIPTPYEVGEWIKANG